MDYTKIIEYINKTYGYDIKPSAMYAHIERWRAWLNGNVKGVHTYFQKTDLQNNKKTKITRNRTNMLLKGSEDWASLLLNEKTAIVIDDEASSEFVMGNDLISGILGENDFWRCANELIATSRWSGTGAFEIYVRNMDIDTGSGLIKSGRGIGINYLSAEQIIPISFENGILREAAFASEKIAGGEKYTCVSVHLLRNGFYEISGFMLDKNGCIYQNNFEGPVKTNSPIPWFSVVRKSGSNIFEPDSIFGVSIISGSEDVLKGLDIAFDNFIKDFILGGKMVLMNKTLFDSDADGNAIAPQEDGTQLFINAGDSLKEGKFYQEYNPALRVQENSEGLQKMLDLFSLKIGLGTKHYQFNSGQILTATQYTGDKQELVQNAAKEMICVEKALKEVVRAILWIGKNIIGEEVDPDAKITVIADDSYIIDQDSERLRWQTEVKNKLRSRVEYRMHFFGETEEQARAAIDKIDEDMPSLASLVGGDY